MDDRRQHSPHSTELHLELIALRSGQRLGREADLSADGFMLFSDTAHRADTVGECRLGSEQVIDGVGEIQLSADCLWSRPGADGQHCWAGFHIIELEPDQATALDVLLEHL
jgi:hypothetical protein